MNRSLGPALAITALLLTTLSASALAADEDETVHACVHRASKAVRIADVCKAAEDELTWNRRGPVGPEGPEGPQGPQGPAGPAGPPGAGAADSTTYAGQYALYLEGDYVGPLHSVQGCADKTDVVIHTTSDPDGRVRKRKIPGDHTTEDCWLEAGLGMGGTFYGWLSRSLLDEPPERVDLAVVRVDGTRSPAAVGLSSAWPSAVGLTPVEPAAEGGAAYLRVRVTYDETEPVGPLGPDVPTEPEQPLDVSTLDVAVDGVDLDVTQVRGLLRSTEVVEVKESDERGNVRIVKVPGETSVPALTFGSASPEGAARLRDWYADLDDGDAALRGFSLTVEGLGSKRSLTVESERSWVSEVEPFPRADGHTRATLAVDELGFRFLA